MLSQSFGSHVKVEKGEKYFEINIHVANEKLYFVQGFEIVLQQVAHDAIIEKKKIIHFVLIFHLFKHGCPINDCTTMQRVVYFMYLIIPRTTSLMGLVGRLHI
jgi:hypothetical protein